MRRKTLSLSAATLLIWAASSSAATVDDLKVCKHSYVLVADDYTNNGTGARTKGALFGDGYFLDVTGGSVAANKGNSNPQELLADGETYRYGEAFAQKYANYGEHLNSLRIKNAQDVIAMKVTAGSKLVFLAQGNNKTGTEARIPKIATDAGMTNVLNDAPTADFITANGETICSAGYMYEWTASTDNTIYIGSYNSDVYIGYIMVEVPEATGTPTVNVGAQTYDATEGLWYREVTCTPATVYGTTTVCTYTTDGTDANASSTLYTGPIKCYKDMTIKFQAYLGEATESKKVANGDNVADVSFKFDAPTIAVDGATFTIENETAGAKNYYSYGNIADLQGDGATLTTSATVTAYSKIQNGGYATFTTKSVSADVLVLDPIKSDMKIGVTGTAVVDYEAIDYTAYTTNDAAITGANDKYFFFKNTEFGLLANADANLNQYQVPTGQEVYLKMSTTNITFIVAEGDSVNVKVTCSKNSCKDLNGEVTLSDGVVINNPRQCYVNVDGELYGGEDLKENPDGNVITFGLGRGVHTFQKYSGTGNILISSIEIDYIEKEEPTTIAETGRTAPEVTGLPLADAIGQNVYLYNVGMKTFLTGSNYWGTRASAFYNGSTDQNNNITEAQAAIGFLDGTITVFGYLWGFNQYDGSTYTLANKTTHDYLVADNADGIWVDGNTTRPYNGWTVTATGNGNQFKLGYQGYDNYYLGFANEGGTLNTSVNLMSATDNVTYTDKMEEWLFVSPTEYENVIGDLNTYHIQQSLLSYISTVEATYNGIELADIKTAANDASASADELRRIYSEDIASAISDFLKNGGIGIGTDVSYILTNPDFSLGTAGWTFEASTDMGSTAADVNAKCAEAWRKSSFDIYQVVKDAPVGVYEISVQGFYREGRDYNAWSLYFDDNGNKRENTPASKAYVYLNDHQTPLANVFDYKVPYGSLYTATGTQGTYTDPREEYWYPNGMEAAGQAFDEGAYKVSAFGLVAKEGDALRIGAKGNVSAQNDSWAIFTRFTLTYQGFKADIIWPELQKAVATLDTDVTIGSDVKQQMNELISAAASVDQTDGQAMFNLLADIYALETAIEKSAALFEQLESALGELSEAIDESKAVTATINAAEALYNDLGLSVSDLTDAQATDAIEKIEAMITKLAMPDCSGASDYNPIPMTTILKTPSFVDKNYMASTDGWTMTVSGTTGYGGYEFYNKDFNIYQELKGLPAGTYRIGVQAFSRDGLIDDDANAYNEGTEAFGKLYAQTEGIQNEIPLQHCASVKNNYTYATGYGTESEWYSTAEGSYYYAPNNMEAAESYFDEGNYHNYLYIKIAEGETLRLGVKCENHKEFQWVMMDNFTLEYYGTASSHFPAICAEAPSAIEELTYTGEPQTLISAGSVEGGEMQYSLDGTTFTTELPSATNAGTYKVYYRIVGDAHHDNAEPQTLNVTIGKAEIADMTAPNALELTYTGEAQALVEAGAVTGGTMQYSATGKLTTYSTQIPTGTDAGTYTVYYRVAGDANHNDVDAKSFSVTIAKATITDVIAPSANTLTYNGEKQALVAAGSANGGEMLYSLTGKTLTYYPVLPTGTNAKTYTVYYKVVADENHLDVEAQTLTVTIARAAITEVVAPSAIENLAYNGEPQTLISAGSATGGEMQYSLNGEIYSTTAPSATKAGNYEVHYKVVADENHLDVEAQTVAVNISKVAISEITAPSAIEGLIYTSKPLDLANAGSAVGGEMQYSLNGENFTTEVPSATNAETYTVYYRIAGDENHFDVDAASFTVTIQAIDLQIAAGEFITFYSDKKLAADVADVMLYTVTAVTDDAVVIKQLDVADAQTPLLIYNGTEQSTVRLRLSSDEATTYETGSGYTFAGTLVDKAMPGSSETTDYYVCTGKNFVWVKDAGTVAAHNCWLEIAGASNAALSRKIVVESEEVLDVISLKSDNGADDAIYDILGRKIDEKAAAKGMSIRQNRIVIIK
ncbi:MAG: chitobiase/beta-hexosaminidase C-terminal domain-containing protein [Bacteroidales bacterium]|nr:chitobiase/beta-hexosaminidase C-terminal domain-containing protein [Bacteroidales bacterium]